MNADRFAGCLVGQALGDALGFIVEGHSPEECAAYVDFAVRPRRLSGYSRDPFPIGQYPDNTQLARELALSFVACGGFDPAGYAARVAAIFTERRIVGCGMSTLEAALRLPVGAGGTRQERPHPLPEMEAPYGPRPPVSCSPTIRRR